MSALSRARLLDEARCGESVGAVSLFQRLSFFLSVFHESEVRLLPSHVELGDVNIPMSFTKGYVGHACVVEH